jgi:plastocyanin
VYPRTVAAAAAALIVAACGSSAPTAGSSSGGGPSTVPAGRPATVVVKGFAFAPGNLTVAKGTKVTWRFEDTVQHNVTSDGKKFRSPDIQHGSYSYTFNTPGTYSYFCSIHQYMKGTVHVR